MKNLSFSAKLQDFDFSVIIEGSYQTRLSCLCDYIECVNLF
jgi:hypothetical protein